MVISVSRAERPSEKILRGTMIVCAVLFLLFGILFSSAFMLPCFLMAAAYYVYKAAAKREWEYTLEEDCLLIERVGDQGRSLLHELRLQDIEILAEPSDPAVAKYRRGGECKIKKYDYTSYRKGVPYYTMVVQEDGRRIKLLLDLPPEAIQMIRLQNRAAVLIPC